MCNRPIPGRNTFTQKRVQSFHRFGQFQMGISPFRSFEPFDRQALFITAISPFKSFKPFNRFAPFKALRQFKVQSSHGSVPGGPILQSLALECP
jgi:hypothetical protein